MYISIDMGGTSTRISSTKDLKNIYRSVKFKTHKDLVNQKNILNYEIKKVAEGNEIKGICFGVPGTLDIENRKFIKLPNYIDLNGKDFNYLLSDDLKNIPFIIVNDAHMAGYYEAIEGIGKNYNRVLYISIGTGIGGLYIENKDINMIFKTFEPGHEYIFPDNIDFEGYCSGHNFHKRYDLSVASYASDSIWVDYSKKLSEGLSFFKNKYNSDVIVLGGGFSINNFNSFINYLPKDLNVLLTEAGDLGGILGGFCVLKSIND